MTSSVPKYALTTRDVSLVRKAQATLAHADIAAVTDHQMIERIDIKQLARLHDLARHQDVLNIYMENHLTV